MAIKACLESTPLAKNDFQAAELAIILLKMNGGRTIEIRDRDGKGGTSLKLRENGYTQGSSSTRDTLEQTQAKLEKTLLGKGE